MLPPRSALRPERGRIPVVCVRTAAVDAPSSRSVALPGARSRTRLVRRRARRSAHAPRHACSLPMVSRLGSASRHTRTSCGTRAASLSPTRATIHAPYKPTSATGTSSTRCAIPSCRPSGSRTSGDKHRDAAVRSRPQEQRDEGGRRARENDVEKYQQQCGAVAHRSTPQRCNLATCSRPKRVYREIFNALLNLMCGPFDSKG